MCYFHLYAFLVPYITIEHQSYGDKVGFMCFYVDAGNVSNRFSKRSQSGKFVLCNRDIG